METTHNSVGELLTISGLAFTPARSDQAEAGLLGWVSCVINGKLRLDGITLRRTLDGRLALSFPERGAADGTRHPIVRPTSDEARREIEDQIFAAIPLGKEGSR
jgi:DNA-binding cell septation regulator SpoVG